MALVIKSKREYEEARAKIRDRMDKLLAAVDALEAANVSPSGLLAELQLDRTSRPVEKREAETNGHGGRRVVANPGAETWCEAIDKILSRAPKPLLVSEIVGELREQGRNFGPRARPDTIVRSTLNRNKDRMDWKSTRGKPRRWRKNRVHWAATKEEAQGLH